MSCKHGNWADCEECAEEDAAYEAARKTGAAEAMAAHKKRWAFKVGELRHYLTEAHGFAAMSPRGKENIGAALEILDELGA